jgi:4-carboxymuconolactone decarboxylase
MAGRVSVMAFSSVWIVAVQSHLWRAPIPMSHADACLGSGEKNEAILLFDFDFYLRVDSMEGCTVTERFPPLEHEQLTLAQRSAAASIREAGTRAFIAGADTKRLGAMMDTLLRRPDLLLSVLGVSDKLRENAVIPKHLKELAILCVARQQDGQYAWFQHEALARSVGLDLSIIESIRVGQRPPDMNGDEAVVYDFVTQWLGQHSVTDEAFDALRATFSDEAIVELLVIVGYFWMGAMILNVAQVPLPGAAPLPLPVCPSWR